MNITVKDLINSLSPRYRFHLIAGKNGIEKSNIEWVSIVEDYNTEKFTHTNIIVITAGVNTGGSNEKLLDLAKSLSSVDCRALILNTGKYITEISRELKEYCNSVDLPLYTIPWEITMTDVVRDIARIIIHDESETLNQTELIQNIIFNTENLTRHVNQLSAYELSADSMYCPIIIKVESNQKIDNNFIITKIKGCCERAVERSDEKYVFFVHNQINIIICIYNKKESLEKFIDTFKEHFALNIFNFQIYMCIGHKHDTIYNLSTNFKRLIPILNVAKKNNSNLLYYDDMGIYKIFSEVSDVHVLKEIYDSTIATLIRYDKENYTELTKYLKSYILCDGNVQQVANINFVHRNTVNNHLRKIKEITGINPLTIDGKLLFSIGIKISELYNF